MTAHFTEDELVTQLVNRGVPMSSALKAAEKHTAEQLRLRQVERAPKAKRRGNTKVHKVDLEAIKFKLLCKTYGVPVPITEHPFAVNATPPRNFRFDFAWIEESVALEKNGGIWRKGGGAHQGAGYLRDMEKLNLAQSMGWVVLQIVPRDLCTLATIQLVRQALSPSENGG